MMPDAPVRCCRFFVHGLPAMKGSTTGTVGRAGKVKIHSDSDRLHRWQLAVGHMANQAWRGKPLERGGAIDVAVCFFLPKPKRPPTGGYTPFPSIKRFDLDKMLRAIYDGMSGIVYEDDGYVTSTGIEKRWAAADVGPGARVYVAAMHVDRVFNAECFT